MNTFIYYTGIGCNNSHKHTDEEFLTIIDNLRTTTTIFNEDKDYNSFTIDDWIEEAGAHVIYVNEE